MSSNEKYNIPWRERPFVPLLMVSELLGVSPASVYRLETEGRLVFRHIGGRTVVTVTSLIDFVDTAEEWSPSTQGTAARAARSERARQKTVDGDGQPR